jgi:hypothetical protein
MRWVLPPIPARPASRSSPATRFRLKQDLDARGAEILLRFEVDESGNAWVHFRAPDGNIYELTQNPGSPALPDPRRTGPDALHGA